MAVSFYEMSMVGLLRFHCLPVGIFLKKVLKYFDDSQKGEKCQTVWPQGRHDIQPNDTQHNGLVCDTQHN
jgi:hypothetical protein